MGNVFNISSSEDFLNSLVAGVVERYSHLPPEKISQISIFLPTSRSCVRLRDIFPKSWPGNAMLLPKIMPLGESSAIAAELLEAGQPSDMPAIISGFRRQSLLADIIKRRYADSPKTNVSAARAMAMAESLIRLMDEAAREELSWQYLPDMLYAEYAEHWEITAKFLKDIITEWRELVRSRNFIEPVHARNIWLGRLAESWQQRPDSIVIIAGSTGSQKATRRLMQACLNLGNGAVILPGYDFLEAPLPPVHPQYAMCELLGELGVNGSNIKAWHKETPSPRQQWLRMLMLPAEKTACWHDKNWQPPQNISIIEAKNADQEAVIIAMLLKKTLLDKGKTAALVTPNRNLARRVSAELKKSSIECDDSAGMPLGATSAGILLRLVAELPTTPDQITTLLAILKHPLTDLGISKAACRGMARSLEIHNIRPDKINDIKSAIYSSHSKSCYEYMKIEAESPIFRAEGSETKNWQANSSNDKGIAMATGEAAESLKYTITKWLDAAAKHKNNFKRMAESHIEAVMAISSGFFDEPFRKSLEAWQHDWQDNRDVEHDDFAAAIKTSLDMCTHRPTYGQHPRIAILSPMEARLISFDHIIIGSMVEGTWPANISSDGWMNRAMRHKFGFAPLEQTTGQSAHDVVMLLSAPYVTMTRPIRDGSAETTASRWWQRIEALNDLAPDMAVKNDSEIWSQWLEREKIEIKPLAEPRPKPSAAARPRRISITEIETLLKDPYRIYTNHVLRLRPLDELEAEPAASDFGNIVHKSFEAAARNGSDVHAELEKRLDEFSGGVKAEYWRPRLKLIGDKFTEWHQSRLDECRDIAYEMKMETRISTSAGDFIIHGRADRVELLKSGGIRIIDYKTKSKTAGDREVSSFTEPQLPIEAWLLLRSIPEKWGTPSGHIELEYWHLRGKSEDDIVKISKCGRELAAEIEPKLISLLEKFADPKTPYLASPTSRKANDAYGYTHLERLKEWRFG